MELVLFSGCDMNYILYRYSFMSPGIVNVIDLLECSWIITHQSMFEVIYIVHT